MIGNAIDRRFCLLDVGPGRGGGGGNEVETNVSRKREVLRSHTLQFGSLWAYTCVSVI